MLKLDHIGYVVDDIEKYCEDFVSPLLAPRSISEIVEDPVQKVRIAFVTLEGGGCIELIQPMGGDSPVSRHLKDGRGGLYHVCYSCDDLDLEITRFKARKCWRTTSGISLHKEP